MRTALDNGELTEVGRAAHRLKGTAVYLGAQPATDATLKVEQAAKSGNPVETRKAINELEHHVESLKEALASHSNAPGDL